MAENEKEHGVMNIIKEGLSYISQIISATMIPPIANGTEVIMKNIENRIIRIEKRIIRNISSLFIIGLGGLFLIFSLFFFLIEYLEWNKTLAFFSIGIIIFVTGLLLKAVE
ncbi:MAG: hypothetical protein WC755_07765 [Candidatus Woesearchaeota archaeon]|jgi:hypothetical protein